MDELIRPRSTPDSGAGTPFSPAQPLRLIRGGRNQTAAKETCKCYTPSATAQTLHSFSNNTARRVLCK